MDEMEVKITANKSRKYLLMYYNDPITDVREERTTKRTHRREALKVAARWEAELRSGSYTKVHRRLTWEEFRDLYFEDRLADKKYNTQRSTATGFNHLERIINPKMLLSVDSAVVARFKKRLSEVVPRPSTASVYLRGLRSALNWAVKHKYLAEAPQFEIPKQRKGPRLMRGRPITSEEYERILSMTALVRPRDASDWHRYQTGRAATERVCGPVLGRGSGFYGRPDRSVPSVSDLRRGGEGKP